MHGATPTTPRVTFSAMLIQRRSFLTGLGAALVAAPAIVRAASLMPVRGKPLDSGVRILVTGNPAAENGIYRAYCGEWVWSRLGGFMHTENSRAITIDGQVTLLGERILLDGRIPSG